MLKRLGAIVCLITAVFGVWASFSQPVFREYADSYEVYLDDDSSLAQTKRVNKLQYFFLTDIKGESVTVNSEEFDLEDFFNDFDARLKFTESTPDSQIYYAYSPKVKRVKRVKGQNVNLHVVVCKERVVLGSPLIFGSF